MDQALLDRLETQTAELASAGLFKRERVIASPQDTVIRVADGREVLNLCANNYLGLAQPSGGRRGRPRGARPLGLRHGQRALHLRHADGAQASSRSGCQRVPRHRGHDPLLLVLRRERRPVRDAARRARRDHQRRAEPREHHRRHPPVQGAPPALREQRHGTTSRRSSKAAGGARFRLIATDGVFSMDGVDRATSPGICDLADRYDALVMVDDSHAVGFMGARGRGTHEHRGVMGRVDIITGTLGKALGGASGGYVERPRGDHRLLRQRSRPYLFSNTLAPVVAGADARGARPARAESTALRDTLAANTRLLPRRAWRRSGFTLLPGEHPIMPGHARRRGARGPDGRRAARRTASTSSASPTPSCRRARRASARRCRRAHARPSRPRRRGVRDGGSRTRVIQLSSMKALVKAAGSPASGWRTCRSPRSAPTTC